MNNKIIIIFTLVLYALTNNFAHAASQTGATVTLTGTENNGAEIYVGITPNVFGCVFGGFYFSGAGNLAKQDLFLDVALKAKELKRTVRVDFVAQPNPSGIKCVAQSIYIE